jgi:uroporphyrinogen decarboxylase
MISRRRLVIGSASAVLLRGAALSSKERVDHALKGEDVDRSPFSFWHHFLDESKPPESHAQSTLAFHDNFHTDLVKVMSDYPYPKGKAEWFDLKIEQNPFPKQVRALELIRDGLAGKAYFIETIFNPWNVAEKLSSPKQVSGLMQDKPQQLLDTLEIIAKSEANHAKRAVQAGASGVLLAIANAQAGVMTAPDYAKFSEPFDQMVLKAIRSAPLNVLHLHSDAKFGDKLYFDRFHNGWPAAAINYSLHTGIGIADLRQKYDGVIMAGLDERGFRSLSQLDLKRQWAAASRAAGKKFILSPGCSVPNDSTDEELSRLPKLFGA